MTRDFDGYVADIPYLRDFKPMLAPAWLDHVALVCGVDPPTRANGFAWCDLGCGQGVTAAILAGYPSARNISRHRHDAGAYRACPAARGRGDDRECALSPRRFRHRGRSRLAAIRLPRRPRRLQLGRRRKPSRAAAVYRPPPQTRRARLCQLQCDAGLDTRPALSAPRARARTELPRRQCGALYRRGRDRPHDRRQPGYRHWRRALPSPS